MKERRFNVGDKVTYKSNTNCRSIYQDDKDGEYGEYYWGGDNQDGYVGIITEYICYMESKDCYKIEVTARDRDTYTMLECEFVEYDKKPEYKSLIGRYVKFNVPLNDTKAGTCLLITEDYISDECMEVRGYGAFVRSRLANGNCELMPEGWEPLCSGDTTLSGSSVTIGTNTLSGVQGFTTSTVSSDVHMYTGSTPPYGFYPDVDGYKISFLTNPPVEIHIPIGITHQEAIIIKRNKKSNKLVIK